MATPECDIRDPRMRRTRHLLQAALGKLMRAKGLDEITVQEIAEAATVNRATFYDHYTDKYALLEAMVSVEFHELLRERAVRYDGTCSSAAAPVIRAACDYLVAMQTRGGVCEKHKAFDPMVDAALIAAIRRVLSDGIARHTGGGPAVHALRAAAVSGAIFGAVKQWFLQQSVPDQASLQQASPELSVPEQGREPVAVAVQRILDLVTPMLLPSAAAPAAGAEGRASGAAQPSVAST